MLGSGSVTWAIGDLGRHHQPWGSAVVSTRASTPALLRAAYSSSSVAGVRVRVRLTSASRGRAARSWSARAGPIAAPAHRRGSSGHEDHLELIGRRRPGRVVLLRGGLFFAGASSGLGASLGGRARRWGLLGAGVFAGSSAAFFGARRSHAAGASCRFARGRLLGGRGGDRLAARLASLRTAARFCAGGLRAASCRAAAFFAAARLAAARPSGSAAGSRRRGRSCPAVPRRRRAGTGPARRGRSARRDRRSGRRTPRRCTT